MMAVEVNTTVYEIPSYTLDIHNGTEKTPTILPSPLFSLEVGRGPTQYPDCW